jgi:hypothetical protein
MLRRLMAWPIQFDLMGIIHNRMKSYLSGDQLSSEKLPGASLMSSVPNPQSCSKESTKFRGRP